MELRTLDGYVALGVTADEQLDAARYITLAQDVDEDAESADMDVLATLPALGPGEWLDPELRRAALEVTDELVDELEGRHRQQLVDPLEHHRQRNREG